MVTTATQDSKQWWDPYETSHRRQFVSRPNLAAELLLRPISTSFIDSCSQSGSFGSTVYNKEFSWKPACKCECIRTGTASGQRRNNPHPSQSFLMWRLPRGAARTSEYVAFPWNCSPSDREIREALSAQYCSTYTCNFMGMPQGYDDVNKAERRLAPLHSRCHLPLSTDTEMRDNYRQPKLKSELLYNLSHNSCNRGIGCGIGSFPTLVTVPTVVQRHVHTQQKASSLTTNDHFYGKRHSNVSSVMKSLLPQELQQLQRILSDQDMEGIKTALSEDTCPKKHKKVNKLPAVVGPYSLERISSWPGPH